MLATLIVFFTLNGDIIEKQLTVDATSCITGVAAASMFEDFQRDHPAAEWDHKWKCKLGAAAGAERGA